MADWVEAKSLPEPIRENYEAIIQDVYKSFTTQLMQVWCLAPLRVCLPVSLRSLLMP